MTRPNPSCVAFLDLLLPAVAFAVDGATLVFQEDFGLKDRAVSAMKGVARGEDPRLSWFDLTHEIPEYGIREASFRLKQTTSYRPAGTVFVNGVDPGVGTEWRAVPLEYRDPAA
jgi:S-adenosylmethionine hydrolase